MFHATKLVLCIKRFGKSSISQYKIEKASCSIKDCFDLLSDLKTLWQQFWLALDQMRLKSRNSCKPAM